MSSACRSFLMLCLLTVAACQTTTDPVSTPDRTTLATMSAAPLAFRQVSAGGYHSCGVTSANRLYCWGYNASGQLGDGTITNRSRSALGSASGPSARASPIPAQSPRPTGCTAGGMASSESWGTAVPSLAGFPRRLPVGCSRPTFFK